MQFAHIPKSIGPGVIRSGGSQAVASVLFEEDRADGMEELLLAAAKEGDMQRLSYVLQRFQTDPVFNLDITDRVTGNSSILWAAKRGHGSVVIELLRYGCDVTILNMEHQSAFELGSTAIRRIILENASKSSAFSYRLLLQASWLGNDCDVRRLLSLAPKVINTNFVNCDGFNAIQLATRDISVIEKVTRQIKNIHYAPIEVLRELLRYSFKPNEVGTASELKTAMHFVARCTAQCCCDVLQLLLHSGGDPTCRDNFGYTPLHWAARAGNCSVMRLLLENGAVVNDQGKAGSTPLHLSALFAHEEAVSFLIHSGANPRAVDGDGQTPVDVSRTRRIKYLLEGKSPRTLISIDTRLGKPVSAGNVASGKKDTVQRCITRAATCANIWALNGTNEPTSPALSVVSPSISSNRNGPVRLTYSNNFREVSNLDSGRSSRCSSGNRSNRPSSSLWKSSPTTPTHAGIQLPSIPHIGNGKKQTDVDLHSSAPFMNRSRTNLSDHRWFSSSIGDIARNSFDDGSDPSSDLVLQGRVSSKTCLEDVEDDLESGVIPLPPTFTVNSLFPPKEDLITIHEASEESGSFRIDSRVSVLTEQTVVIPPISSSTLSQPTKEATESSIVTREVLASAEPAEPVAAAGNVPIRRKPEGKITLSEASGRAVTKTKIAPYKSSSSISKQSSVSSKQAISTTDNAKDVISKCKRPTPISKNKIVVHKPLDEVNNVPTNNSKETEISAKPTNAVNNKVNEQTSVVNRTKPSSTLDPPKMTRNKTNIAVKSSAKVKAPSKPVSASRVSKTSNPKGTTVKAKTKQKQQKDTSGSGGSLKKHSAAKDDDIPHLQSPQSILTDRPVTFITGVGWQLSTDDLEYDDDFEECDSGNTTPTNSTLFKLENDIPQEVTQMDTEVSAIDITDNAIERFRKLAGQELSNLLGVDMDEEIKEEIDDFQSGSTFTLQKQLISLKPTEELKEDIQGEDSVFDTSSIVSSSSVFSEMDDGLEFNGDNVPNWKKLNRLGHGSYGTVYKGLTNFGTMIAIKQIPFNSDDAEAKSESKKIQEEIDILKNLNHCNVVQYMGTEMTHDCVNIFMEFVAGGSLANLLQMGPIDEPIFRRYARQLVEGVHFLHNNNIIHRDIKGANVMLTQNGVVKLIDFGCAKRLQLHLSSSASQQMSIKGSPYWMAPEVIRETGHGRKSDIWSIGCTVFEMAMSKPPWGHLPYYAAIFAIGQDDEPSPRLDPDKFSASACQFVSCCMNRDAPSRPTAQSLRQHKFLSQRKSSRSSRTRSLRDVPPIL